ncbi:hypothetical protein [Clostridium sardiniense]|uniref:hypothetical protein n=1 Tax=Clostridium sardiniense TaxID=29369 RepID=UPI003D33D74C
MSSYAEFNIDDLVYEEFNDAEVKNFESFGESFITRIANRKKELKREIATENYNIIKEEVDNELEVGEFIKEKCTGTMGWLQYLSATMWSADYYVLPFAFWDVSLNYRIFITDRKIMIFEVTNIFKIQRQYIIDFKDIDRYKGNVKKGEFRFFAKKDKYDEIRMSSNWLLYYVLQGRFDVYVTSENKQEVVKLLDEILKK